MNILLLISKMKKIIQIILLITFFDFETSKKNEFKFENNRIVKYMHYKWIKQRTQKNLTPQ